MAKTNKTALIIGAGPAGLTAAYELLHRTDIKPIIIEKLNRVGGISTTIDFKGNKLDIGGHRFFSKSDRVLKWWFNLFLVEEGKAFSKLLTYQNSTTALPPDIQYGDPNKIDNIFLIRDRKSRIYYNGRFYKYPIELSLETFTNLGLVRTFLIIATYTYRQISPKRPESSLEDFYINRFGDELYTTFFKTYTEKVWGTSPKNISPEWGRQRAKGLSISKVILHFFKNTNETSLTQYFLYPKYGPGQLWDHVLKIILRKGGELRKKSQLTRIYLKGKKIEKVEYMDVTKKIKRTIKVDYVFSSMPMKELAEIINPSFSLQTSLIANKLSYRDFIIIGVLVKRTKKNLPDNWIYVHDPRFLVGRIQIFNNWSPYMVKDKNTVWIGMEYFTSSRDKLWLMKDKELINHAIEELVSMDFIEKKNFIDATVIRMEKVYPSYTGTYSKFSKLKKAFNNIPNLYLIGRNGMHKYNNQDHSMLTAMLAVDNIISGSKDKTNIWNVNTEQEYHESK